jgi:hypothetical protein
MSQGIDVFEIIYTEFGQQAVLNFVRDRQENGQLLDVIWETCGGCDCVSPFRDDLCLMCGGK